MFPWPTVDRISSTVIHIANRIVIYSGVPRHFVIFGHSMLQRSLAVTFDVFQSFKSLFFFCMTDISKCGRKHPGK